VPPVPRRVPQLYMYNILVAPHGTLAMHSCHSPNREAAAIAPSTLNRWAPDLEEPVIRSDTILAL
jgi:hypothetical protein